jgi:hypothetical protein
MAVSGVGLAREIEVLSQRANTAPRDLQRMAAAARTVGVDMEGVSSILQDVNDRVGDFLTTGAGPMADFFEQIAPRVGVTADQFRNLSGPQALQLYVTTLQRAGVNQQQMTFFLEAMSSEATRLLPLLADNGAEMRRLGDAAEATGQIIEDSMIGRINRASEALGLISGAFDALRLRLAAEVAPALEAVSDRFVAFMSSRQAQDAIDRLADAFGRLVGIVTSADFLNAVTAGFEGLINLSASAAEGLVAVTQNLELFTAAASAAAIGLAAIGGPITAVVAATGVALVGLSRLRARQEALARPARSAAEDEAALAEAIGGVAEALPGANTDTVVRYQELETQARNALAAAEAELALAAAQAESARASVLGASGFNGVSAESNPAMRGLTAEMEATAAAAEEAADRVERLQDRVSETSRTVQALLQGGSGSGSHSLPGITFDSEDDDNDLPAIPGLADGGGIADQFEGRLEAILEGLATEREVLDAWYAENREVLAEARERGLLEEQEYQEQRLRLEEEYARRSAEIERLRANTNFQIVSGGLNDILSAAAQGNERIMRVQRAFAAGMAWIDTIQGAARELRRGTFGFATAAAVIAKGIGFVQAINSTSSSSRGAASGGASTSASSVDAQPPQVSRNVAIQLTGGSLYSRDQVVNLINSINEAVEDGAIVRLAQ